MGRNRRRPLPSDPVTAIIESFSHDGRGVTRVDGKTVFVAGALPGEEVVFRYVAVSRRHDEAVVEEVLRASPERVEPKCAVFGVCGGCSLQHQDPRAQILGKQQTLLDNLQRIGHVTPEVVREPLRGPLWAYRRKGRLGVRYVPKKGGVLVGFRERAGNKLAVMERCEILDAAVGPRLAEIGAMIAGLDARDRIAQIEVAVGDNGAALAFRNLDPLSDADLDRLRAYGDRSGLWIFLQPGGPDTVQPLWPLDAQLRYRLDEFDVEYTFRPNDFTQVNAGINRAMIPMALDLLDPQPGERVLDLFCGLGNFSLPLARRAGRVVGVEVEEALVQRARANAEANGIANVEFHAADLFEDFSASDWAREPFDKLLLDPARTGAHEICQAIERLGGNGGPRRIVYVSCHPGTLARDAGVLVNEKGYRLLQAGVMDMFPHTTHVESIAVFERG